MHINSQRAYDAIDEAWSLDADRPLVIAGGLKAIYEPYHFWPEPEKRNPTAPDVAVTGEQYVLLELLDTLLAYRGARGTMRSAFELARSDGALDTIPGLVYLAPGASVREPVLIDTGLQRLVRDLDELPGEETRLVCSNRHVAALGYQRSRLMRLESPVTPRSRACWSPRGASSIAPIARFRPSIRRVGAIEVPRA